jgi:acyl-CoA thioester hydrolase
MSAPLALFEYRHVVRQDEIDQLGHVNNLNYLHWTQDAANAHSTALGWPTARYLELGAGWVVSTHEIQYQLPAFLGDEIIVQTWVVDMKKVASLRRFAILRAADRSRMATAATNFAFVDFRTGRLKFIPREVADAYPLIPDLPAAK